MFAITKQTNEIFAFYHPYVLQTRIKMSTSSRRYTIVTTNPDHSYNWVVCESLGKRDERYTTPDGTILTPEIELVRKLGALGTDFSSKFVLGRGRRDSILKKINVLFV